MRVKGLAITPFPSHGARPEFAARDPMKPASAKMPTQNTTVAERPFTINLRG